MIASPYMSTWISPLAITNPILLYFSVKPKDSIVGAHPQGK